MEEDFWYHIHIELKGNNSVAQQFTKPQHLDQDVLSHILHGIGHFIEGPTSLSSHFLSPPSLSSLGFTSAEETKQHREAWPQQHRMVQRSLSQPPPLPHGWPSLTTKPRTTAPPSCLSSSPALNRPRQCYLDLKLLSLSSLSHPPPSTAVGRPTWRGSQRGDGDQAERWLKRWWRGLEDDDRLDDLERAR